MPPQPPPLPELLALEDAELLDADDAGLLLADELTALLLLAADEPPLDAADDPPLDVADEPPLDAALDELGGAQQVMTIEPNGMSSAFCGPLGFCGTQSPVQSSEIRVHSGPPYPYPPPTNPSYRHAAVPQSHGPSLLTTDDVLDCDDDPDDPLLLDAEDAGLLLAADDPLLADDAGLLEAADDPLPLDADDAELLSDDPLPLDALLDPLLLLELLDGLHDDEECSSQGGLEMRTIAQRTPAPGSRHSTQPPPQRSAMRYSVLPSSMPTASITSSARQTWTRQCTTPEATAGTMSPGAAGSSSTAQRP